MAKIASADRYSDAVTSNAHESSQWMFICCRIIHMSIDQTVTQLNTPPLPHLFALSTTHFPGTKLQRLFELLQYFINVIIQFYKFTKVQVQYI